MTHTRIEAINIINLQAHHDDIEQMTWFYRDVAGLDLISMNDPAHAVAPTQSIKPHALSKSTDTVKTHNLIDTTEQPKSMPFDESRSPDGSTRPHQTQHSDPLRHPHKSIEPVDASHAPNASTSMSPNHADDHYHTDVQRALRFQSGQMAIVITLCDHPDINENKYRVVIGTRSLKTIRSALAKHRIPYVTMQGISRTERRIGVQDPAGNRIYFKQDWPLMTF